MQCPRAEAKVVSDRKRQNFEEQIFSVALEMASQEERSRYLDDACRDDPPMRQSIEELLRMHQTDPEFLETPALDQQRTLDGFEPGLIIDRYTLIEKIGEGGFGIVWKAAQSHPIQREVAIKVVRHDRTSAEIVYRFERERQTLAAINHPHIATVFDAGTAASGQPYFAMELVEGDSITAYCNSFNASIGERVDMLVTISEAVHYAHQRGILHRDLKPSNVLVGDLGGKPQVKVIDFGIAKLMQADAPDEALGDQEAPFGPFETRGGLVGGTPQFMSPEQYRGDLDVNVTADVYALGGIAYQLLTGWAPYESEGNQSPEELSRLVCGESNPILPSRRESRCSVESTAGLRGDLDAIVLKALQGRCEDRYASASEFAADLNRWRSRQPVAARGGKPGYVLRRLAARHKALTFAIGVVAVSLVAAFIGISSALFEAQRARAVANIEANNAKQVSSILQEMLGASDPARG
ncbi:MAG: serine/threonine-protein kinase, partial [Planctomycetota bacterium]